MTTTTWEAPPLAPLAQPRRTRARSGVLPTLWLGVLAVLAFWWTGTRRVDRRARPAGR